jgi:Uncharacterized protein conserved in bacteria (DUF2188)
MAGQAKDVHTVPLGDGWINEVGGARVGAVHRTQEAAIVAGRALAMQNQSEHSVHGKDGKIREKNSYGNDPRSIRG